MSVAQKPIPVSAVLFDTFGTVVDWRTGVSRHVRTFFDRFNLDVDCDAFADAWRSHYQPSMDAIRVGKRGFVRLDVIHRENLLATMQDFGISCGRFSADEIDELNKAWHNLDPWPDSVDGIRRLKRKYIVAPLSNGNISLLTNMAKRAEIPWDCILGAEVVRDYKPKKNVYTDTADILGLRPDQCMMVAAHNDDLLAASQAGLRTGFVLRRTEHGPKQTTDLFAEMEWDVIADDIMDLANRIG